MNDSTSHTRALVIGSIAVVLALLLGLFAGSRLWHNTARAAADVPSGSASAQQGLGTPRMDDMEPTMVYAHNLMLRKGPDFRIYVVWIAGEMVRTHEQINPTFDDPESFVLQVRKGVIRANIGDISNYLNHSLDSSSPLHDVTVAPDGEQLRIRGTMKKVISMPVEIVGTPSPTQSGLIRFHVNKISILKIPMKAILGGLDVKIADIVKDPKMPGLTVDGNDLFFDTQKLLPPPHIHGQITTVHVHVPDIEVIYGNAPDDPSLAQWHNFLRFRNGALDFGKLTMHHVDLTMIDAANEPWFDLDLVNYQSQLVNGDTRMTAQAGLEIYMPSLKDKTVRQQTRNSVTMEWLRNRNSSLPPDIASKTHTP